MANLLFRPAELLSEIEALRNLSAEFLDPTSFQLEELAADIEGLRTQKVGSIKLEIPKSRPLRTRVSEGEFERADKTTTRPVFATISGVWAIEASKHRIANPERPGKKTKPVLMIGFTGLASTEISVFDVKAKADAPIAHWKMELGHSTSPGCFFHTFASADGGFPVPRHPNLFPTPMAAIGFALGELFQDGWEEAVSGATDPPQRWRSIQRERLLALLSWQAQLVRKATSSPWCALKEAKPSASLFA